MKVKTGKAVPFSTKNISNEKNTESYKSKTPIAEEVEEDSVNSFANITQTDHVNKNVSGQPMESTPSNEQAVDWKSLIFSNPSNDEEEESEVEVEVEPAEENILNVVSSDHEESEVNEEVIIFPDGNIPNAEYEPTVDEEDYISDAVPVSDSDDDETDEDADHDEIERIFLPIIPSQLRIGSVIRFTKRSMHDVRST